MRMDGPQDKTIYEQLWMRKSVNERADRLTIDAGSWKRLNIVLQDF